MTSSVILSINGVTRGKDEIGTHVFRDHIVKMDFHPVDASDKRCGFVAVYSTYYLFGNSLFSFRVIILCFTGSQSSDAFWMQK